MRLFEWKGFLAFWGTIMASVLFLGGCHDADEDVGSGADADVGHDLLVEFEGTHCKQNLTPETGYQASELNNIQCIAWERLGGDALLLELFNFPGDCISSNEIDWEATVAASEDDGLGLSLVIPKDYMNACGTCAYDFRFRIEQIDWKQELPLDISISNCVDCDLDTYDFAIPVNEATRGIRCRHYDGLSALVGWDDGGLNRAPFPGNECDEGLVLGTPSFGGTDVCLKPCETVEDCPEAGSYDCDADGLCQLVNDLIDVD